MEFIANIKEILAKLDFDLFLILDHLLKDRMKKKF